MLLKFENNREKTNKFIKVNETTYNMYKKSAKLYTAPMKRGKSKDD